MCLKFFDDLKDEVKNYVFELFRFIPFSIYLERI